MLCVVSLEAQTGHFRQEGNASVYSSAFQGRATASGERYNADLFTAAHPTLPFGTVLGVINTQSMRSVTVRVNDRGPFIPGRIIELSRAAANAIGLHATGTAYVILEHPANQPTAPRTVHHTLVPPTPVFVQQYVQIVPQVIPAAPQLLIIPAPVIVQQYLIVVPQTVTAIPQPARQPPFELQTPASYSLPDFVGVWEGSYYANQGETGLSLTVFEENGKYRALFYFYNLPGKTNASLLPVGTGGSYYMNVTSNHSTRRYNLVGNQWINRPGDNWFFVDLEGVIHGNVFTGNSLGTGPAQGTWAFRLVRR